MYEMLYTSTLHNDTRRIYQNPDYCGACGESLIVWHGKGRQPTRHTNTCPHCGHRAHDDKRREKK